MGDVSYLSEFAGRLVTGLKMHTLSKHRYSRYISPTLNVVYRSNVLHTKLPPEEAVVECSKDHYFTNQSVAQTVHRETDKGQVVW